jgi:6-phosphogluconolactonase
MVRRAFLPLFFLVLGGHAVAAISTFYLGTYTGPSRSEGVYVGTLDTETGRLGGLKLAAAEKNPNFLAVSPDHQFVFAAQDASVESFRVQPDGTLRSLGRQPSGGPDACDVNVDRTGRAVFVASYDGGEVASFPVGTDGRIGPRASLVRFTGSGPNPNRQKKPYAHAIYADTANAFVYACDLGTDSVWIFKLGPGATLTPASPPAAKVPPGSGPRHLVFSADGRFVYVVNEMGVSVSIFSRDAASGALTLLDTVSNLWPGDATAGITGAEIALHPSGKWLYVSNRGHDTLSVFAVDPQGGLKLLQNIPCPVKCPRSFGVDPTGGWMIAAGQNEDRIALLKIDPATGKLAPTDATASVGSPVCVLFVPDSLLTLLR